MYLIKLFVDESKAFVSFFDSSSGKTSLAICLPYSTPHWSKELIFQLMPWVKILCSYSAINFPKAFGVNDLNNIEFDTKKYKEIPPSNVPYHYGCGSIYSTVEDFLLWNRNLFEETSANKRIIKKSTIKRWFPVLDFIGDIDLSSNILQRS